MCRELSSPEAIRKTVAWDRGVEMHKYLQINQMTGVKICFCDPSGPWQRPTNEKTYGTEP